MFDNIGKKIKKLAKFFAYVCIICGIIVAVFGLVQWFGSRDYIEYASVYGGSSYRVLTEEGNKAYYGLQLLKYGLITAISGFVSSWPLYGFGELIDNVNEIRIIVSSQTIEPTPTHNLSNPSPVTERPNPVPERPNPVPERLNTFSERPNRAKESMTGPGWICSKCGKKHYPYESSCSCGASRFDV